MLFGTVPPRPCWVHLEAENVTAEAKPAELIIAHCSYVLFQMIFHVALFCRKTYFV